MSPQNIWAHYKWAIFFCAVSAIGALCYGYDNTYYNRVLAMQEFKNDYGNIRNTDGKLALSSSFQSVTASGIYIGDLLGAILAAPLNDRYGRKSTFWLASFCIFIGGICQVADILSLEGLLVVVRILIGLGVGQFTVTSLLYIGEVAPPSIRGPALMCFQFLQSWSELCASAINQGTQNIKSSLGYRIPMGGLVVLPLIMAALLPFIPESPLRYVLKGRRTEAEQSFHKINQSKPNYDPLEDLATAENAKSIEEQHAEFSSWGSLITDPIERRKLTYSAGAMFSQQICGILFFYVYGVVFAQAIGLGNLFLVQLITNIVQIFAVGASIITANRVRRRINLMITNFMMLVAFITIGDVSVKPLTPSTQYVIVVFSFVVMVGFNFGLGPLAYTVAREMAVGPNQNKIMSASIVIFYLMTWVVSFTAPYLYYDVGLGPMVSFVYAVFPALVLWFAVGAPITSYLADRKGLRKFPSPGFAGISSLWRIFYCFRYQHFAAVHEAHKTLGTHVRIAPNYTLALSMTFTATNFLKDAWYDGGAGAFPHMADERIKTEHQRKRK
ncbi:High-affinity glucose transporter RGT2 [Colletotrichum gloeosporioides]|uniref:High-affinity glucose transporter RGT2 n=1 Tax=Colletotrichum gloeosporioides TaxID=474922 RepID=A0A8H4CLE4_COLGL|nr:High-affinity glucose transporter RGT2 [Colletotrichum gloeosporioides]KAF3806050.1 High-affinity glucose transporter RGT2 [Colletotrichum gloeosporioides]